MLTLFVNTQNTEIPLTLNKERIPTRSNTKPGFPAEGLGGDRRSGPVGAAKRGAGHRYNSMRIGGRM